MAQVDTVIPNSLNYTDIKPQAIENKIQLCRYQPTSTITGAKGGDMVKFLISGNGFLDPYSTYLQFKVNIPTLLPGEVKWVDRSAHSFIQRMVIRSQGVELERIENYDVIAAMINDVIYSPEQCTQHYWEGFPTHLVDSDFGDVLKGQSYEKNGQEGTIEWYMKDEDGNYEKQEFQNAISEMPYIRCNIRDQLARWLCQGASPSTFTYIGETAFHQLNTYFLDVEGIPITNAGFHLQTLEDTTRWYFTFNLDAPLLIDHTYYKELAGVNAYKGPDAVNTIDTDPTETGQFSQMYCPFIPVSYAYHQRGRRVPAQYGSKQDGKFTTTFRGTTSMQFIIPIYSGVIGLLMPEKKLLPLNLLPLDIEIVFNNHALYSSHETGSRSYQIQEFFLYGNTLFFEQEIHRTLEASVADHGLFIYCNSFHTAPQQLISTDQLPSTMYISMNLKSINSVHWVFLYAHYEQKPCARKLHFVSHNITKMQLLNGTQLIPQYPVEGDSGTSRDGSQMQFHIELLKAWNKMHDPTRDSALHAYNTCGDEYACQFDPITKYRYPQLGYYDKTGEDQQSIPFYIPGQGVLRKHGTDWLFRYAPTEGLAYASTDATVFTAAQIINKQANVGRCQYGISLEGEELGTDRTMITGRKSQYPFQLQLWSRGKFTSATSYMMTFLRADFIIYIRPDLQIVTLGK